MKFLKEYQIETSSNWELISTKQNFDILNENCVVCNNNIYKYINQSDKAFVLTITFKSLTMKYIDKFSFSSNNRFIEIYIMKDQSFDYFATIRGSINDSNINDKDLYNFQYNERILIKGIQFKFLSIKALNSLIFDNINYLNISELFLKLGNFQIDFNNLNNLDSNNKSNNIDINNHSSINTGMNVMLHMMEGCKVFNNNNENINNEVSIQQELNSKSLDKSNISNNNLKSNHTENIDHNEIPSISIHEPNINDNNIEIKTTNNNNSSTKSNTTTTTIKEQGNTNNNSLDLSQLSTIMWTVKNTIISEMNDLLDQKLVPIINRLDHIEKKIQFLSQNYNSLNNNNISKNSNGNINRNINNSTSTNNNDTNNIS